MVTTAPVPTRAWELLAAVPDPEIPAVSVVDLGIVRDVEVSDDGRAVTVTLTPTYSGCPATEVIAADVRAALETVYDEVHLRTRLSPAWTTDWMSEEAKDKLHGFGIAPPSGRVSLPMLDAAEDRRGAPAACPRCRTTDLEEIAGFGSTPCKALWRCRACREPFDYFKQH